MPDLKCIRRAIAAIVLVCATPLAIAQTADKPIRIIVPFAAGGGVDAFARPFAKELAAILKQPVLVENHPSTTGQIGANVVAGAPADGNTLLISSASFSITPAFVSNLPYDIFKSFEPVSILVANPQLLLASNSFKGKSMADVIRMAREGSPINFAVPGSSGIQRLAVELIGSRTDVKFTTVPYKGASGAFLDLISGRVDLMFDNPASSLPLVNSGKVQLLATTSTSRMPSLPNVPSVSETVAGFEALNWFVLVAPAGTPGAVLERLNKAGVEAMRAPGLKAMLDRDGVQIIGSSREEARKFVREEFLKWDRVVKDRKLTID